MRTEELMPAAEEFYASVGEAERQEIERIVRNLCQDPAINNKTTFTFAVPPAIMTLYADANYWILYHLPNQDTLRVMNIGRRNEKVRMRR